MPNVRTNRGSDTSKNNCAKGLKQFFSEIKAPFLRKIHAVTFDDFLLRLTLFIFATTLNKILYWQLGLNKRYGLNHPFFSDGNIQIIERQLSIK